MENLERLVYSNPAGSADLALANGSIPVPAAMYASTAVMLAALNNGGACAVLEAFDEQADSRNLRVTLTMGIDGADDSTVKESAYLVGFAGLDGNNDAVFVESIGDINWSCGTVVVPSVQGGRANHKFPKAVSIVDSGLLAARTGRGLQVVSRSPATVEIFDLGPARYILRVIGKGAASPATGFAPMRRRWR